MRRTLRTPAWSLLAVALMLGAAGGLEGSDGATELLKSYLRIDTSNPPGGEDRAAAFLADQLHREGIATQLLVSPHGRVNLFARLDGGPEAEGTLVLLHHMDVVPPAPGWSVAPFAGTERDGFIWGAGAVDDKSLGIAHLEAFLDLARSDAPLAHHVAFVAVSDEETGGGEGAAWLMERHADLFSDTVAVLTEGGNNRAFQGRLAWWGVEVAQKRPLWLEVTARGRPGHGSTVDLHTAPNRLLRGLNRLLDRPRTYRITDEARLFFGSLQALAPDSRTDWLEGAQNAIERGTIEAYLKPGQHNLFMDTIQITVLDAGRQVNAIPAEARALVDVRALPDTDIDALLAEIRSALGDDLSVSVQLDAPPVAPSPADGAIFACIDSTLSPRAPVVPSFMAGVTDSRYFRQRGIPAYGFSPFAVGLGDAQGVHGIDERLSTQVFEDGVETMIEVVFRCASR